MLPRLFAGIRIRLIILVLLAALPAFVLVTYDAAEQRQHELEEAQKNALLFASRMVSDQDELLQSSRALLAAFAQAHQIQDKDAGPCNEIMAASLAENPAYANLYVADTGGTVFCSALPSGLGVSMADRDYFQGALASSTYAMSKYQLGRASGKPSMAIGYPFRDDQGKVAGVVAASTNLGWFLEKTSLSTLPAGSTLLVLDDKATVLAVRPHNDGLVGSPLKSSEALRKTLTASPGTTEAEGPDGKQQLWASAPIGNAQGGAPIAYVSVSIPLAAAFAEANQRFAGSFLLLGVALLAALGAAWWLGGVLVGKRIQALVQASKRLAGGDFTARSGLRPSEGELGQLAHSFDEMAGALEHRQAERDQANRMLQESEARYRAVVENASDGIFIIVDGCITYANWSFLRIHGLTDPSQVLGADPTALALPEYHEVMRQRIAALLRGEAVEGMHERRIQRPDGEVRTLQVSGATITLNGKPAALGIVRDVTERKRVEEELQESEARYRAVVENANDGICILVDGRITYVNPGLLHIGGFTDPSRLLGVDPTEFVLPEYHKMMRQRIAGRLHGDVVEGMFECRIQRSDGEIRTVQVSGAPITLNGKPAALSILRDITESKHMEDALRESEAQFRAVVENANDGISILVGDRITYINQAYQRIHGLNDPSQVLGTDPLDTNLPEYREILLQRRAARLRGEPVADTYERRILRPDGQFRTIQVSGASIILNGRPATLAIHRDVTEQKRSDDALRESEAQYRAVVENARDGISISVNGIIEFANHAYLDIYGFRDINEAQGTDTMKFVMPDFQEALRQRREARLRGEQVSDQYEYEIRRPDGEVRTLQLSGSLVTFKSRPAIMLITRDTTERKRNEEQLRESNRRLTQALEELGQAQHQMVSQERLNALGQMASGIVHDFNNALTPILGFTSILIDNPEKLEDRATTLQYLNLCHSAGEDAARIVSRLRDFYRPRDQAEPFVSLNVNDVVRHVHDLTQYVWKDKAVSEGKTVALALNLGVVPSVTGNLTELTEVLTNLIINAVDAIPASGSITIRTTLENESVVLEVHDSGAGMPEEIRRRCFEPFFTTKGNKGTGLGLAVAYGIIQRHGGRIAVDSQVGVGTTFRIWLPAAG